MKIKAKTQHKIKKFKSKNEKRNTSENKDISSNKRMYGSKEF